MEIENTKEFKEYEKLLDKAMDELPEYVTSEDRFKVEKIRGHLEGNKTVLTNFIKIAKSIDRNPDHMLKYILKELATPGKIRGSNVLLGTKVPASKINKKIEQYIGEYVLCHNPECRKPDTELIVKRGITYIKCKACGNEYPVKG